LGLYDDHVASDVAGTPGRGNDHANLESSAAGRHRHRLDLFAVARYAQCQPARTERRVRAVKVIRATLAVTATMTGHITAGPANTTAMSMVAGLPSDGRRAEDVLTASRILGDQVGSTAPGFLAVLAVHVLAGLAAVATGAIAALARKGSPRHILAGRWYYWAITAVFATATVLAAMRWRQDYYLFIIGAVAFTAATFGYQHRRHHRPGDTGHIAGMGVSYVAMLTAFYVDNGPHLPLWSHLPTLAFWLLPSAIGAPVIVRAVMRARHASSAPRTRADA
jgi:hypothetical protein